MKRAIISFVSIALLLGAVGCGAQDATMSSKDRASFAGGGPGATRSPEQQKAMSDFIGDFKKKHPGPPSSQSGSTSVAPPSASQG